MRFCSCCCYFGRKINFKRISFVAQYGMEWHYMAMCRLVWPFVAMFDHEWPWNYIAFSRGHRSPFIWSSCCLFTMQTLIYPFQFHSVTGLPDIYHRKLQKLPQSVKVFKLYFDKYRSFMCYMFLKHGS